MKVEFLVVFFSFQVAAFSAVTVVWRETPTGVEADYFGSLDLNALGITPTTTVETPGAVRNNLAFSFFGPDPIARYVSSGITTGRIVSNPEAIGSGTGIPFGFSRDILFIDPLYVSGDPLSGRVAFPGYTLDTIFPTIRQEPTDLILSDFVQNVEVVWAANAGDNSISYLVVPEPSTIAAGFIALIMLGRKRR